MDVSLNSHNQDDFLNLFPLGSFLQGRFWKQVLLEQGIKSWQLNVYDGTRLVAHCLLYSTNLPFGKSYLYAPKGPLFIPNLTLDERKEAFELILSQIRDITIATRKRQEIFCRLEPNIAPVDVVDMPMLSATAQQPQTTLYLDLNQPLDTIFASFKEKTRYNIRLAEKHDITTQWANDEKAFDHFVDLIARTGKRKKIRSHEMNHYQALMTAGRKFDSVYIGWAEYKGEAIAANMYVTQPLTTTYLHGGFDYKYRELMAPHLLQWEAIKKSVERGALFYDFWGIAPEDGSKPSWEGFTRFKKGFSGNIVTSPGCFDFMYDPVWYKIYTGVRKVRGYLPF